MIMERIERIGRRLPRFYRSWDEGSLLHTLIESLSRELDIAEETLFDIIRTKWVETAEADDLDSLGSLVGLRRFSEEDDAHFRTRLVRAVDEYKGGGTVTSILEAVRRLVRTESEGSVTIVENPEAPGSAEFTVRAGDNWQFSSESIEDADPTIALTVEEGGEVSKPEIANIDTGESFTFDGKLGSGQTLSISREGIKLDGKEVAKGESPNLIPRLPRWTSTWRYSESLGEMVGVFDEARFDEQTFAVGIPPVRIRFEWERLKPAEFEVRVDGEILESSDISKEYLQKVVDSMKAAGTIATVCVKEE